MAITISAGTKNFDGAYRSQATTATTLEGLAGSATIPAPNVDFLNVLCSGTVTQGAVGVTVLAAATGNGQILTLGKTTTATGTANIFLANDGAKAATGLYVMNATDHIIRAQHYAGEWHVLNTNCTQSTATD